MSPSGSSSVLNRRTLLWFTLRGVALDPFKLTSFMMNTPVVFYLLNPGPVSKCIRLYGTIMNAGVGASLWDGFSWRPWLFVLRVHQRQAYNLVFLCILIYYTNVSGFLSLSCFNLRKRFLLDVRGSSWVVVDKLEIHNATTVLTFVNMAAQLLLKLIFFLLPFWIICQICLSTNESEVLYNVVVFVTRAAENKSDRGPDPPPELFIVHP